MGNMILMWQRFESFLKARVAVRSNPCIYLQTDAAENVLRVGQSDDLWRRYFGGTAYAVEAALHGSGNLFFVARAPADAQTRETIEAALIYQLQPLHNRQRKQKPPKQDLTLTQAGQIPLTLLSPRHGHSMGGPVLKGEAPIRCGKMLFMVPSKGPESWREVLRDPETQWRDGYSAKELAQIWEAKRGFPDEVAALFRVSGVPALQRAKPVVGFPEYQVALPGGDAPSQSDLVVLATGSGQLIAIAVEGKAKEGFGEPLHAWLQDASMGKQARLAYLKSVLGLSGQLPPETRYQLLHRAASAVLVACAFSARFAVLLVHSFGNNTAALNDFKCFLGLFDACHNPGKLVWLGHATGVELYAGWAQGKTAIE